MPRLSEFYGIIDLHVLPRPRSAALPCAVRAGYEAQIRIDDDEAFGRASVDPVAGTVCWPNGIDLDPDVLHGDHQPASGRPTRLVTEYRLQRTR